MPGLKTEKLNGGYPGKGGKWVLNGLITNKYFINRPRYILLEHRHKTGVLGSDKSNSQI